MYVSILNVEGCMSTALCVCSKSVHVVHVCALCVCMCIHMLPHPYVCECVCRAISKEANSLVDRNCYGLEEEPLAAVMQVEPHKPHQSHQQHNEAELLNRATAASMWLLLLPQQQQAKVGRQHVEGQACSVGQTWGAGTRYCQCWSVFRHTIYDNLKLFLYFFFSSKNNIIQLYTLHF